MQVQSVYQLIQNIIFEKLRNSFIIILIIGL